MEPKHAPGHTFNNMLFLQLQGQVSGPFSQAQVKESVKGGWVAPTDQLSTTGKDGPWVAIHATSLLKYLPNAALAAVAPTPPAAVAPSTCVPAETVKPIITLAAPARPGLIPAATTPPPPVPVATNTSAASPAAPAQSAIAEEEDAPRPAKRAPHPARLPRFVPRLKPSPEPVKEKHIWGTFALCVVALATLLGGTAFFFKGQAAPSTLTPTNAHFANQTYDLMMESRELWEERRAMRLRLEPDQRVTISESAAPIEQVTPLYHSWAIEENALVFRSTDHQPCDRYPGVRPGQKELTGAETLGNGKHHLVRVRP